MQEMTDLQIEKKHRQIRRSDDLKYPGSAFRCMGRCGHYHDEIGDQLKQHRCFLGIGHREEFCEFSSACGEVNVRPKAVTLTVDGVAA